VQADPPDLCDSYNRRRLTRTGGHTAELLAAGDEERRSDRGCQPRAYARPGSWTAGRPVDLAAAIAQIQACAARARRECFCPRARLGRAIAMATKRNLATTRC
jgi:hypothetical protein